MRFQQADWPEPALFELGSRGRRGCSLPALDGELEGALRKAQNLIPEQLRRREKADLPEVSEAEVARHFTRLSEMNFGVDSGFYPLGSCTMKYNPKINEALASSDKIRWMHPNQPEDTMQGTLEIMYRLTSWLAEITGTSRVSLQPAAGAQGEFAGVLIIRAHQKSKGLLANKNEMIIPNSAHGTNPASAAMGGFKIVVVPTGEDGCIDIEALKEAASSRTAGLMLTNPNTLGLFEDRILEITEIIHEREGVVYYDGANLNAILGKTRPGDMGFDIVHVNLHKTFSTPHGGGGPGAGPIGVKEHLKDFLPVPQVEFDGNHYYLNYRVPHSIGKVQSFYGSFAVLLRAFVYVLTMGEIGLRKAAEIAVLNANYLAQGLSKTKGFDLPYGKGKPRKHEFVLSCSPLESETGISAQHIAKRLLDYGVHAPTIHFPPIVKEALMIEPTETEPLENLDKFIDVLGCISREAYTAPATVSTAPHNTSVHLVDEAKASHPKTMCLSWRMYKKNLEEIKTKETEYHAPRKRQDHLKSFT
jgi:glycine dehydrogenase subunit 2